VTKSISSPPLLLLLLLLLWRALLLLPELLLRPWHRRWIRAVALARRGKPRRRRVRLGVVAHPKSKREEEKGLMRGEEVVSNRRRLTSSWSDRIMYGVEFDKQVLAVYCGAERGTQSYREARAASA
jgi:hypothetical protein